MRSSFLDTGLEGITTYSWGTDEGKEWKDQSGWQKTATALTLPFRAVKRVVVAQTGASVGVILGTAAGIAAGYYFGLMGWAFVGSVAGGLVLGGLIGWGISAFFGADHRTGKSYAKAAKAPVSVASAPLFTAKAPVTAGTVDPQTGAPLQAAA